MNKLSGVLTKNKFLITVSLPKNDAALAVAAEESGADAIKVHTNVVHKASGTRFGTWEEEKTAIKQIIASVKCPVGLMPGAKLTVSPEELKEAYELGIDFIDIYDFDMPAWMLRSEPAKMVALGSDFSIERAKSLGTLGADYIEASIVPSDFYRDPLTVRDLENYTALAAAVKQPVLVPSQKLLKPEHVEIFKKAGVKGIILGTISIGGTPESFREKLPRFINAR